MKKKRDPSKVIEVITITTDLSELERIFKKHAEPRELPYLRKYLKRVMKEGTAFLYLGAGGLRKNDKLWQYNRFECFFRMATKSKTLKVEFT